MKTYKIQFGEIETKCKGVSKLDALMNYAKDSGYISYSDLVRQRGHVDSVIEVKNV